MKKHAVLQQAVKFHKESIYLGFCFFQIQPGTFDEKRQLRALEGPGSATSSRSPSRRYARPSLTYPLNTARAPCDPSGGKVRAM